jgi:uncharacterized protein (DUF952 family)
MEPIFHITSKEHWHVSQCEGEYRGDTLASEGFIHCSTAAQIIRTANFIFRGRTDLVVLRIAPGLLKAHVVYEDTSGTGEDFPHIYGPLNLVAVEGIQELVLGADGSFLPLSAEWITP